jgi:hypothetical protein
MPARAAPQVWSDMAEVVLPCLLGAVTHRVGRCPIWPGGGAIEPLHRDGGWIASWMDLMHMLWTDDPMK